MGDEPVAALIKSLTKLSKLGREDEEKRSNEKRLLGVRGTQRHRFLSRMKPTNLTNKCRKSKAGSQVFANIVERKAKS